MNQPSPATTSLGLPLPPTGRRIHLGEHDGQVRLTCLPRLFVDSVRCWLAVGCFVVGSVLLLDRTARLPAALLAVAGVVLVAWFYATGRPQTRLTVTRERLRLEVSRTLRPHRWECGLHQVVLIRIHSLRGSRGLWIVTGDRVARCLADRDAVELNWVAHVLQRAVGANGGELPGTVPARPGEVAVSFLGRPQSPAVRGFLLAQRHTLALRYDYLETPHHEFFAAPAFTFTVVWRSLCGPALPLAPADLRCRREDAPPPQGVARLEITRPIWPRVALTVWCDDAPALQAAVARFWGAAE
jgi:hypothetical protein